MLVMIDGWRLSRRDRCRGAGSPVHSSTTSQQDRKQRKRQYQLHAVSFQMEATDDGRLDLASGTKQDLIKVTFC
jgi:hypothetical protein